MQTETYQKPFDDWHPVKKVIHARSVKIVFKEGEVWWCHVGVNVGFETDGKGTSFTRPVLIMKKFSQNMFFGLPFTSKDKKGTWYVPVMVNDVLSQAVLSQVRTFDTKRLQHKILDLSPSAYKKIKQQLGELLGFVLK